MRWIATTFADFAAAWSAASNSKPGTQVVYEGYLRLHLLPRLGAVEMGKLAPQTIEAFKVACHEHGLSARTISWRCCGRCSTGPWIGVTCASTPP